MPGKDEKYFGRLVPVLLKSSKNHFPLSRTTLKVLASGTCRYKLELCLQAQIQFPSKFHRTDKYGAISVDTEIRVTTEFSINTEANRYQLISADMGFDGLRIRRLGVRVPPSAPPKYFAVTGFPRVGEFSCPGLLSSKHGIGSRSRHLESGARSHCDHQTSIPATAADEVPVGRTQVSAFTRCTGAQ